MKELYHYIGYDPGSLPKYQPHSLGEKIALEIDGWPPWKDRSASIRNPSHKIHNRFVKLRVAATNKMGGKLWYKGPVQLNVKIFGPLEGREKSLTDYVGGIMDSLDGFHGPSFTYIPICYEDDCQICSAETKFVESQSIHYSLQVGFL